MKPGTLTPSTTMYITAQEALDYLGMASGSSLTASKVEEFIKDETAVINEAYESYFCSTESVDELYDAPGKDDLLILRHRPLISVDEFYYRNSITEDWIHELTESDTYAEDKYMVESDKEGIIKLWSPLSTVYPSYGLPGRAWENVYKISYTFGYASIPYEIKSLCKKMVARDILLFKMMDGSIANCVNLHQSYRDMRSSLKKEIEDQLMNLRKKRVTVAVI